MKPAGYVYPRLLHQSRCLNQPFGVRPEMKPKALICREFDGDEIRPMHCEEIALHLQHCHVKTYGISEWRLPMNSDAQPRKSI